MPPITWLPGCRTITTDLCGSSRREAASATGQAGAGNGTNTSSGQAEPKACGSKQADWQGARSAGLRCGSCSAPVRVQPSGGTAGGASLVPPLENEPAYIFFGHVGQALRGRSGGAGLHSWAPGRSRQAVAGGQPARGNHGFSSSSGSSSPLHWSCLFTPPSTATIPAAAAPGAAPLRTRFSGR